MINIYSQSGQVTYGIKYYTVDTENEKNSLPTKDKMGSKCYVIESETWYILNGNGEWVPFVGEDSTADAILISIKNMSAEQKDQLKEELDIEDGSSSENAVLYTAQTLTADQQAQARMNIGASGSITVDTQLNINSTNPVQNKAITVLAARLLEELDEKADEATTVTVEGTDPTITPAANTIYKCGTLDSLTITNPPATGAYSIVFTSGATPTVTTIPATILGLEDFAAEANTIYEINVLDNCAVFKGWPLPGVSA